MWGASRLRFTLPALRTLAMSQPSVSRLDRASRMWSIINLERPLSGNRSFQDHP
jgi:hypothetical protein